MCCNLPLSLRIIHIYGCNITNFNFDKYLPCLEELYADAQVYSYLTIIIEEIIKNVKLIM